MMLLSNSQFTIERFTTIPEQHLASFRAIYESSFPPAERADFSDYVCCIANSARWFFGAVRRNELIGFATFVPEIAPCVHLLEYLAIASSARNEGLGGTLFDQVAHALDADFLLEVESDDECADDEREMRQRRIRFYERHGAQIVTGMDYRAPRLDGEGVLPMKLMWWSSRQNPVPQARVLAECVRGIYTQVYQLKQEHPLVQMLLRAE